MYKFHDQFQLFNLADMYPAHIHNQKHECWALEVFPNLKILPVLAQFHEEGSNLANHQSTKQQIYYDFFFYTIILIYR